MTTVKTNISMPTVSTAKPSAGAAAGSSASQISTKPKIPEAPKAPTVPTTPKTPLAKEQKSLYGIWDDEEPKEPEVKPAVPAEKTPEVNTLDYSKINKITQKPPSPTLDYAQINKQPEQPEPKVLNYKDILGDKPQGYTGNPLKPEPKTSVLDSIKAKQMFRKKFSNKNIVKQETLTSQQTVTTPSPPLSGAGSQSNVAKFNAGLNNQPGLVDTISGMFKKETLQKKQGVPTGVDPAKQERCVKDVKAQGHGKVSAIKICNASIHKDELHETCEKSDLNISKDSSVSLVDRKSKMRKLKEITGKKTTPITKSEREFIQDDLLRPYTPYFNDVDELAKSEFHPLIQEFALHAAIQIGKGEKLSKSDPLDKYKIDKGGSLKFGTHVPSVGFPRNTLTTEENKKVGSDEGSGGEIKSSKKYQMTKAEIQEDLKSDWQPKFKK